MELVSQTNENMPFSRDLKNNRMERGPVADVIW